MLQRRNRRLWTEYCCLGVLNYLVRNEDRKKATACSRNQTLLSVETLQYCELDARGQATLATLNDEDGTWDERVITWIEVKL